MKKSSLGTTRAQPRGDLPWTSCVSAVHKPGHRCAQGEDRSIAQQSREVASSDPQSMHTTRVFAYADNTACSSARDLWTVSGRRLPNSPANNNGLGLCKNVGAHQ